MLATRLSTMRTTLCLFVRLSRCEYRNKDITYEASHYSAEQQRKYISKAITDGIAASEKRSGRKIGQLDKMTDLLKTDIELYLHDRKITQAELMKKHSISRNTLKKYIALIEEAKNK